MEGVYLILGGAGLVGLQVCRQVAQRLSPRRIVVASLLRTDADEACRQLREELASNPRDGRPEFVPEHGDLFVPTDLADRPRADLIASPDMRARLLASLYEPIDEAYAENHLVRLIARHEPEVIVDCVNTATGLSYQDVWDGAARVRDWIGADGFDARGVADLEAFLLSQSVPQIVRHVRFVQRATTEHHTRVYLKVGTTGTGGMGLNIPYTHSEDRPSKKLLAKTEAAFGHTGLLFLLARTPGAPIVKEIKPGAMIGYRAVQVRPVRDQHGNGGVFAPREEALGLGRLDLREGEETYERTGDLRVAVVDTGENGLFTRGEFAAITALGQMEYITPEEIARVVALELSGVNTGQDVISAMDATVMNPSYKAGLVRNVALSDLAHAEDESGAPSVALGRLGPPELSKLLFEAHLFKFAFGSLELVVEGGLAPDAMSRALVAALEPSGVARAAPSIGIPVLLPDGHRILRGPRINVPEQVGHATSVPLGDAETFEGWVRRGWIDLRPSNMARWLERFGKMLGARATLRHKGSAAASLAAYMGDGFEIGEVVAWIFNNEMGGYRVK